MGLARVRKPEGLVSREARSKARSENAIRKRDRKTRFESAIQIGATLKCNQQARFKMRSTDATHKCDRQVRLTSAID